MDELGSVLQELAPAVDTPAAFAAFRQRRRRRRHRRVAGGVIAVVIVAIVVVAIGALALDDDGKIDVTAGPGGKPERSILNPAKDFDVIDVREARGADTIGQLRSAVNQAELDELWQAIGFRADTPRLNNAVIVSITIADDACPPELTSFDRVGDVLTPVFVESERGCDEPLIPKTYVVRLTDREALRPSFTLRLPANSPFNSEQRLVVAVPAPQEPVDTTVTSTGEVTGTRLELPKSGACGEAIFWAASESGDVAVTVTVEAQRRSTDMRTTIPISLPSDTVTVRILRGRNLQANFCTDVINLAWQPTSSASPSTGDGSIVLDPAPPRFDGCGGVEGTMHLNDLMADDGTAFAPISVTSMSIGCYSG